MGGRDNVESKAYMTLSEAGVPCHPVTEYLAETAGLLVNGKKPHLGDAAPEVTVSYFTPDYVRGANAYSGSILYHRVQEGARKRTFFETADDLLDYITYVCTLFDHADRQISGRRGPHAAHPRHPCARACVVGCMPHGAICCDPFPRNPCDMLISGRAQRRAPNTRTSSSGSTPSKRCRRSS